MKLTEYLMIALGVINLSLSKPEVQDVSKDWQRRFDELISNTRAKLGLTTTQQTPNNRMALLSESSSEKMPSDVGENSIRGIINKPEWQRNFANQDQSVDIKENHSRRRHHRKEADVYSLTYETQTTKDNICKLKKSIDRYLRRNTNGALISEIGFNPREGTFHVGICFTDKSMTSEMKQGHLENIGKKLESHFAPDSWLQGGYSLKLLSNFYANGTCAY